MSDLPIAVKRARSRPRTGLVTVRAFLFACAVASILGTFACCTGPIDEPMRVVAVFGTPIEEPWVSVIHEALVRAETELGISYEYADNVHPVEFEKAVRSYAEQDYDIIVGDAFAAEDAVRRIAPDYPDIAFVFGSGQGPAEPNLSVFDNWTHEPAYLAGMLAGHITTSNKIGAVGGFPVPEVNRLLNAFEAGAREVNPQADLRVTFIESWFDEDAAKKAATALIAQGADIVYGERAGVIEACKQAGIPAIGSLQDQHHPAHETVVTSVLWDMWPTIEHAVSRVRDNTYSAEDYGAWSTMPKGGASLAPIRAPWDGLLDAEILAKVEDRRKAILGGTFRVPVVESAPPITSVP